MTAERQNITSERGNLNFCNNAYGRRTKEMQSNEWQTQSLDWEDFGARMYDPVVARWWSGDELSSKYVSYSNYSAFGANPMKFIDPDGRRIYPVGQMALLAMDHLMSSFCYNTSVTAYVFQLSRENHLMPGSSWSSKDREALSPKEFKERIDFARGEFKLGRDWKFSKEELRKWYNVYLAIQGNGEYQLEVISAAQGGNFTNGDGGGSAGTTYGTEDPHINGNPGLQQMRSDSQKAGEVTQAILDNAISPPGGAGTGPYRPDYLGNGYSEYKTTPENKTTNPNLIKTILFDGTNRTAQQIADLIKESLNR